MSRERFVRIAEESKLVVNYLDNSIRFSQAEDNELHTIKKALQAEKICYTQKFNSFDSSITVAYLDGYTIKLTYFSSSGKYGYEGEYITSKYFMHEIFDEVTAMLRAPIKNLPGLAEGWGDFYILVDVPDHPENYPSLVIPDNWRHNNQQGVKERRKYYEVI